MRETDVAITALTVWRENRGGGEVGMHSVASVLMNRSRVHKTTLYAECVKPWQFSSMTAKADPQLGLWPREFDPAWTVALNIAAKAADGTLPDVTGGAMYYYATSMANPPAWSLGMTQLETIEGQVFLK